jgi:hypothetical protein
MAHSPLVGASGTGINDALHGGQYAFNVLRV